MQDFIRQEIDSARGPVGQASVKLYRGFSCEALVLCERALTEDPENIRAHALLGFALRETGDAPAALDHMQTALRAGPPRPDLLLIAAQCMVEMGDWEGGMALLSEGVRRFPLNGALRLVLGDCLASRGEWTDGIAAYESVARGPYMGMYMPFRESDWWRIRRDQNRAWDAIAVAEQRRGDIWLLEEAITAGSLADARVLADTYAVAKLWSRAADCYIKALRADAGNSILHFNLARVLARLDQWDEAELHLEAAGLVPGTMGSQPSVVLAAWRMAVASHGQVRGLLQRASDLYRDGHGSNRDALRVLSKVQELDPDEPDVHILLSSVYTCQGNAPEALRSAEEALRLSPGNPVAICNTAACLLKGGFAADAEAALRRGAASSARHPRSALLLGDCLGAQGRLDEALSEYERALDFDPQDQLARDRRDRAGEHRRCIASLMNEVDLGNSGAHLGLALELEAVHRWTDAIMECRAALETEPEGREAARCLARCMGASGRVTEARKLFAELRLSWPNDPEPWIEEARVLRTAGRNLDAVHCLRDALTVYPYCARAFWEMVGLLFVEGRWDDAGDALRAPFASEPQARDELLAFQARLNDDELGLDYEDFLRAKELLTAVMYPGSAAATSDNPAR